MSDTEGKIKTKLNNFILGYINDSSIININQSNSQNINITSGKENINSTQIMPSHTLYINNLNEKIKIDELKQNLYHLFSQFGDILEIHARKSFRMKGQAFIIFRDVTSATNGKAALENAIVFGKPMRVNFSKNTSDIITKSSGSFSHKDKIKLDAERKKRREAEYHEIRIGVGKTGGQKKQAQLESRAPAIETPSQVIPNNVLFVECLPPDMTEPLLRTVFSKYSGFREVRLFAGKGIAFVEYDSEVTAGGALLGLNGLNLTSDCVLKISFAKK